MNSTLSISQALKGGAIAAFIAAGANNVWSLIANALGATIPAQFVIAVTLASIIPMILGSLVYFLLMKYATRGFAIWMILSIGFTLVSFFPVFNTTQLADGTPTDSTFPLLVGPMHAISGFLAVWGIHRWSK
ncbi:MAG: DUF6069 family protein [Cyclobacteriaceae bacterium]|nr:DUF6069 family protein [Cyclobacteriaceae bacterium]